MYYVHSEQLGFLLAIVSLLIVGCPVWALVAEFFFVIIDLIRFLAGCHNR